MWAKANEPKCSVILKENNQDSKRQKPRGRVSPILNNIKWQKWIRYHEYNEIGKKSTLSNNPTMTKSLHILGF